MSKIIRISQAAYEKLNQLEGELGMSKQSVIEKALDRLVRENLLKKSNEAYLALRKDPQALAEELEERSIWDSAVADGLEEEDV